MIAISELTFNLRLNIGIVSIEQGPMLQPTFPNEIGKNRKFELEKNMNNQKLMSLIGDVSSKCT